MLKNRTILLVDDDSSALLSLREQIEQHIEQLPNVTVECVHSAEFSIEEIRKAGSYDLVITDDKLGGMSGRELTGYIKQNSLLAAHTKVILITGHDDADYNRQVGELGLDGFLHKPYRFTKLLDLIKALLPPPSTSE